MYTGTCLKVEPFVVADELTLKIKGQKGIQIASIQQVSLFFLKQQVSGSFKILHLPRLRSQRAFLRLIRKMLSSTVELVPVVGDLLHQ